MDKLKLHSPNLTETNIEKIAELFPSCVVEAKNDKGELTRKIDFDQLRQELSDSIVEGPQERYRLDWPGKREALFTANAPIAKTLRPCRDESVDFDSTQNLFIEGDNLDALKLLQENYLGEVKVIYIDPPYNTGKDFIYADDFAEDIQEYRQRSNQTDKHGGRLVSNPESNGRFHSDWLSMMYSRLRLARNLLKEDGVIFISIDNEELTNLGQICDEIYGEANFIECITWNKRIPKNDKGIGNIHDFVLVYAKNASIRQELKMRKDGLDDIFELTDKLKRSNVPLEEAERQIKLLYKKQGYDRGITLYNALNKYYKLWGKINMSWPNANTEGPRYTVLHPLTKEEVAIPDRGWRWKKETFDSAAGLKDGEYQSIEKLHDGSVICGKIWFSKNENIQPSSITYLDEVSYFLLRSILSLKSDGGLEVENHFGGKSYFSYPKPTSLLKILIGSLEMSDGDIILDFFAGSATTADATMQLNAEDGIQRKFIMVQLPEACDEKSEAFKAGYKTISEISKERIRRAGKKTKEGNATTAADLDIGFRVLKIDTSNAKNIYYTPDAINQEELALQVDHIKEDRTAEDLLFQVMLDWGVDLALPISSESIQGKTVYFVDENAIAACFETVINEDFVKELAKREPLRVVFRDTSFESDSAKINVAEIFKLLSPNTDIKTL